MSLLTSVIQTIKRVLGPAAQEIQLYADDEFMIIYRDGKRAQNWKQRQIEENKHEWKTTNE